MTMHECTPPMETRPKDAGNWTCPDCGQVWTPVPTGEAYTFLPEGGGYAHTWARWMRVDTPDLPAPYRHQSSGWTEVGTGEPNPLEVE